MKPARSSPSAIVVHAAAARPAVPSINCRPSLASCRSLHLLEHSIKITTSSLHCLSLPFGDSQGLRSWGEGPAPNILLKRPCINRAPPIIKLQNVVHPCQSVMRIIKCLYCLYCPKFGQLIIRKIIRIVATRCQILGVKCTKFDFGSGGAPDPIWETYNAPPLVELTVLP